MRKAILIFSAILLLSCKKPNPGEGTVHEVNAESLKIASQSLCADNETLVERTATAAEKIYDLHTSGAAFGFLKGTASCALTSDYHQGSISDTWFSVTLNDDCLPNGSVWTTKYVSRPDHSTILELMEFGSSPDSVLRIKAGYDVTTENLASAAGMIFYECMAL